MRLYRFKFLILIHSRSWSKYLDTRILHQISFFHVAVQRQYCVTQRHLSIDQNDWTVMLSKRTCYHCFQMHENRMIEHISIKSRTLLYDACELAPIIAVALLNGEPTHNRSTKWILPTCIHQMWIIDFRSMLYITLFENKCNWKWQASWLIASTNENACIDEVVCVSECVGRRWRLTMMVVWMV